MADDDVVFVLGRERVPLSRKDAKDFNEWIRWDSAEEARPLQRPLKDAIKNRGGEILVPTNDVRSGLLEILDRMAEGGQIQTGLSRLRQVARLPITGRSIAESHIAQEAPLATVPEVVLPRVAQTLAHTGASRPKARPLQDIPANCTWLPKPRAQVRFLSGVSTVTPLGKLAAASSEMRCLSSSSRLASTVPEGRRIPHLPTSRTSRPADRFAAAERAAPAQSGLGFRPAPALDEVWHGGAG